MAEVPYDPSNPFDFNNQGDDGGFYDGGANMPWNPFANSNYGNPFVGVDPSNPYDTFPSGVYGGGSLTGDLGTNPFGTVGFGGGGITPATPPTGLGTVTGGSGLASGGGPTPTDEYSFGGPFGAGSGGTISVTGPGASGGNGGLFGTGVDFSLGGFGSLAGGLAGVGGVIAGLGGGGGGSVTGPTAPPEQPAATIPVIPPLPGNYPNTPNATVGPGLGGNSPEVATPPGSMGPNSPNETNPQVTIPVVPPLPGNYPGSPNESKPPVTIPVVPPLPGTPNPTPVTGPTAPTQPTQPPPVIPQTPTPVATTNPLDRNYYNEGLSGVSALQRLSPDIFSLYGGASGNYGQTDFNNYSNLVGQVGNMNNYLTGQAALQTQMANTGLRKGNLADVQSMGGQYLEQRRQLNPEMYANMNAMDARAQGGIARNEYQNQLGNVFSAGPQYSQVNAQTGFDRANVAASDAGLNYAVNRLGSIGPSSIQQTLESQAASDLGMGRALSPEQTRNAQEAARAAYAARGLGQSNSAIAAEVLNLDRAATERENARRQFAQGVDQTGFAQRNQSLNTALGLSGAAQGYAGLGLEAQRANMQGQLQGNQLNLQGQMANQGAGLQAQQINNNLGMGLAQMDYGRQQQEFNNLNTAAQMRAATQFDPFATIIGQSTNNQGSNQQLFNQATGFSSGQLGNQFAANAFNPFNNYNADVSGSNFNAANARSIAAGNNAAAMAGAKDAATGQIANSFLNLLYNVGGANNWWGS